VDILERLSNRLAKAAAYLSAFILVYMVGHVLFEILLRVWFSKSTYVLDEFVAYSTASITFLCLAYSFREKSLIRVEILIHRLSGRTRVIADAVATAVTLAVVACLAWYFFTITFWRDVVRGTVSESIAEVPLWIPELLALIGMLLFILQLTVSMLRLVSGAVAAKD
jgi:TRAP-type C4-dicarboxylate transport system permease small subunit